MIKQIGWIDLVPPMNLKLAPELIQFKDLPIAIDPQRVAIELFVAIRTKTKDIVQLIEAVVRPAKWADMGGLRVRADRGLELLIAYLAGVFVEGLYCSDDSRISIDSVRCYLRSTWRPTP